MRYHHVGFAIGCFALLAACGGGAESTEPTFTGMRIVAGGTVSDTVQARPAQALTVEVHPTSGPAAGLVIRFESLPANDSTRRSETEINVSNAAPVAFGQLASDTTDSSGRASALVQLGTIAGEARIVVSCPELGLSDTAKFTVLPGNANRIVLQNADTTLFAGASYTISSYAADRFGNRRSDAVSFVAGQNVSSVDQSGRVTAGTTIGRGSVAVRVGNATDSARFTVMPAGTMAFVDIDPRDQTAFIATAKLDGSNKKRLIGVSMPAYPSISPAGDLVAYHQLNSSGGTIYVVDANSTARRLTDSTVMRWELYPHFSGDGAWVYFCGLGVGDVKPSVWRIHPDGSSLTRVAVVKNDWDLPIFGVAPDGSRIADADVDQLSVLQLSTGTRNWLGQNGFPAFSPDSKRLAYVGGIDITILNADLSGQPIAVAPYKVDVSEGLAWTPDGTWLFVRSRTGPILINSATGAIIPVNFPNYHQFAVAP